MVTLIPKKRMNKIISHHEDTQDALDHIVGRRAEIAAAELAHHVFSGDSYIDIEVGEVDRYLVLNDERGQLAAMTIEFGREGGTTDKHGNPVSPMPAVKPLRTAIPEARGD